MLRIKLIRSTVAHQWRTRRVVESLGLRKVNQVVEHNDTPAIRGMVHRVKELLHVEEVEGTPTKKSKPAKAAVAAAPVAEKPAKKAPAKKEATAEATPASEEKPKKKATKKTEDK